MPTLIACPSCGTATDQSVARECPECGWVFQQVPLKTTMNSIVRPLLQIQIVLALLYDRTGSSKQFANGCKRGSEMILQDVEKRASNLEVYVQSHGDEDYGQHPVLLTCGGTPEQALSDIDGIVYGGGGDAPEHHLSAVEHAFDTIPFTADPLSGRGVMIVFMTADSKPAGSGRSAREIGLAVKERGVLLYLVCQPTPTLNELAEGASGLVFEISHDPSPEEMATVAAQVTASVVHTVSTGGTIPLRPTQSNEENATQ